MYITDSFEASSAAEAPYGLEKSAIITDLSTERPQWILSAYGPGRAAPAQLFGGPLREQSFEELRLLHYIGIASGNPQQAVQEADRIYQAAEEQMQTALKDVDGAINYIIRAENEHPNRIDVCRESQAASAESQPNPFGSRNSLQPSQSSNPFGAPSQPATAPGFGAPTQAGPFGQPSSLGQKPNAFGPAPQPGAFGQPSGGAFGQPSALGQKPNPFGAPTSTFGAQTQPGSGGPFGQPSALGQKPNPFGAPAAAPSFGAPTQLGGGGAFGRPSALGQKPNPFGGASAAPVPFGGASQQTQANPFGQPSGQNPNPFGFGSQNTPAQPNPFGNPASTPFGAPSPAPKNPFGAPSQPTAPNPFAGTTAAQPNPFGAISQPTNPNPFGGTPPAAPVASTHFGNPQRNPHAAPNPFGNPPPSAPTPPNANPFGVPPEPVTNGFSSPVSLDAPHPPTSSYITKDHNGRLLTFKGKRVIYKDSQPGTQNPDGTWAKIWFPDGPPAPNKTAEAPEENYTEEIRSAYEKAIRLGGFEGGMIPLVPPKQEWCRWDF